MKILKISLYNYSNGVDDLWFQDLFQKLQARRNLTMWYPAFCYTFQIGNLSYIESLIKLYPDMSINEFKYQNKTVRNISKRPLKELKEILNEASQQKPSKLQTDEVTIITDTVGANCTVRYVLPKFQPRMEYVDNSKNDRLKFKSDIDDLKRFILGAPDYVVRDACILSQVTNRESAWKLLNLLHEKIPFLSAIDLPENKGILLFTPSSR